MIVLQWPLGCILLWWPQHVVYILTMAKTTMHVNEHFIHHVKSLLAIVVRMEQTWWILCSFMCTATVAIESGNCNNIPRIYICSMQVGKMPVHDRAMPRSLKILLSKFYCFIRLHLIGPFATWYYLHQNLLRREMRLLLKIRHSSHIKHGLSSKHKSHGLCSISSLCQVVLERKNWRP